MTVYWRERCAWKVIAGRPMPVGYNKTSMGCGVINPEAR